jgi:hypothetical protein
MRYCEIISTLDEAIEQADIVGTDVRLYRDPSAEQVWGLMQRYGEMRGIDHDRTIWLWNSLEAVHFQIEVHLHLPRKECAEFCIRYYPDGNMPAADDYGADVWLLARADHVRDRLTKLMRRFPVWEFRP